MANAKVKAEGGNKRGHSNMSHRTKTAEIKYSARKTRRAETAIFRRQCDLAYEFARIAAGRGSESKGG